ncbi:MAG: hypothetical protein V4606_03845 [Patescibacteria group bacterium]
MNISIGFIGQGWIGRHYANEFENRDYTVVRYALEEQYINNKDQIKTCDVVFIAVPTPTTPDGFDYSIVRDALTLVGDGKIAVIKSTLLPGTTVALQTEFPAITVIHSPEFLVEATAAYDTAHPARNIIGVPNTNPETLEHAQTILSILPEAPYSKVMSSTEAELLKYAGNCFLFTKVIFMNMVYDLASGMNADWDTLKEALVHDKRIGDSHMSPMHSSGRGAGGHCFIKDMEAFRRLYESVEHDALGNSVLTALVEKNIELLTTSNKDMDLLSGVYGHPPKVEAKSN